MTNDGPPDHARLHFPDRSRGPGAVSELTLRSALVLTIAFVTIEALFGWFGPSLALLSDAGHNLADAAALGLSWYAMSVASKRSHHGMTFGYHRVAVLAALANAVSLVVIGLLIGWESIHRIREPQPANGAVMIGVAGAAIVVNFVIGFWLRKGSQDDINVRGAYLHQLGDAASAGGVVIAGVLVAATGQQIADPIVSLLIAGMIIFSSYGLLTESTTVLLEGTPAGTDMPSVIAAIKSVNGVRDVHDLHVWMVGPGVVACSCHILVAEQSVQKGQQVLRAVVDDLKRRFHITHTTVQVEVEGCEDNDMYCVAQRSRHPV